MGRLQSAFQDALRAEETTQTQWGDAAGLARATVSRFAAGQRPTAQLLKALFTTWDHDETPSRLLLAHIQDEIERAGLSADTFTIRIGKNTAGNPVLEDLDVIERFLKKDSDGSLRDGVRLLADLLRRSSATEPEEPTSIEIPIYEQRRRDAQRKVAED